MELFAKIVNGFQPFTIFAKVYILDVQLGLEYTSGFRKPIKDLRQRNTERVVAGSLNTSRMS